MNDPLLASEFLMKVAEEVLSLEDDKIEEVEKKLASVESKVRIEMGW